MNLYLTADKIGGWSGGSKVTYHESEALRTLGACEVWGKDDLKGGSDPWGWDQIALNKLDRNYELVHLYSGSMTETVNKLRSNGAKVCYTIAAHRVSDSKKAHEELGLQYSYSHLVEKEQWRRYSGGYWNSNVIVVPSKHSALVVNEQMDELGIDTTKRPEVKVIPHGCDIPEEVPPIPKQFCVGYFGVTGADKGIRYLLEAWKKLNYKDGLLILGGGDSTSDWTKYLVQTFGGGSIYLMGWMEKPIDFFSKISVYVQPSATEGFGVPVLEAMAYGRPILCSDHAGACDVVPYGDMIFKASDVDALAEAIDHTRTDWSLAELGKGCREEAKQYTWDKIRERYVKLWRSL